MPSNRNHSHQTSNQILDNRSTRKCDHNNQKKLNKSSVKLTAQKQATQQSSPFSCSRPLSSSQTTTTQDPHTKSMQAKANPRRKKAAREPESAESTTSLLTFHTKTLKRVRVKHHSKHCETNLRRKEVIQPHLPVRLPCYDLVPIASPTFDRSPHKMDKPRASGVAYFHDLTGGVYKARERIHRGVADPRLLATPPSRSRVAGFDPN
jgi:hypothetical protein